MIKRSIAPYLHESLSVFPVVLLTGARQVGKSTLASSLDRHYITLDDITQLDGALEDPRQFIRELPCPVVIDEVQKAPELLVAIKEVVDRQRNNGDYLLTGSANLLGYQNITDTLAGRIGLVELWPMSCHEISHQAGTNWVDQLFSGAPIKVNQGFDLKRVIEGGYPELLRIDGRRMRGLWFSSYISTYIERDVRDIGELRNLGRFIHLVNILASRSASILNKAELSRSAGIDQKTLSNYLMLLEMVYQVQLVQPYSSNTGKRYTKSPKLFFTDSGVLSHLLGVHSVEALRKSGHYGALVETYLFGELLKATRCSEHPTRLWHYRTSDQREVDFLLQRGERKIPIEVKAAETVRKRHFSHIEHLQQQDEQVEDGIVFYLGEHVVPFGRNRAVPISLIC